MAKSFKDQKNFVAKREGLKELKPRKKQQVVYYFDEKLDLKSIQRYSDLVLD